MPDRLAGDEVWRRPESILGYAENLRGLGGVVSPLLAGFSLAAIAQVLTADTPPPLAEWAVLAFAVSVALLLHGMQLAFLALAIDPSPTSHLTWFPEATVDERRLNRLRRRQAEKYDEMVRYFVRSNIVYDLGLNAFLAGVLLLLVPEEWTGARIAAVAVAGAALALEMWWALANRLFKLPHPVLRAPPRVAVDDLVPEYTRAIVDPARAVASDGAQAEPDPVQDGNAARPIRIRLR